MRILIVENDYAPFLDQLYARNDGLADASYEEQATVRAKQMHGIAESYKTYLARLGNETATTYANNQRAQQAWAREHPRPSVRRLVQRLRTGWHPSPSEQILMAQVRDFAPDVLLCLSIAPIGTRVISCLRDAVPLIVGQHAATPLPNITDLDCYDLLLSSFPGTIEHLRRAGLRAEPLRLGFDPAVLDHLAAADPVHDIAFVGSMFGGVHDARTAFLERLCDRFEGMRVWTASVEELPASSAIRRRFVGPAWGLDMFHALSNSRIAFNHHGDVTRYANNSRLYEATGSGALLVTDAKENLSELFEPDAEVLAYEDLDQCVELIERLLADDVKRNAIAQAGHRRTLREHTYERRMEELQAMLAGRRHP